MTGVLYLTYKNNYEFNSDKSFLDWMQWAKQHFKITHLVVVDNFNTNRIQITFTHQNIDVNVIPGDNREREFSGYLKGLHEIENCPHYILLNDTFLQRKHAAYSLLGPAIKASLNIIARTNKPTVFGEINNAPINGSFRNITGTCWISSYCFVFNHKARNIFSHSLNIVKKEFSYSESYLNEKFISHINRQVQSRPESNSTTWIKEKYRATSSEISLSQLLKNSGAILYSIYSFKVSPLIFSKNLIRKTIRKFKFKLGIS